MDGLYLDRPITRPIVDRDPRPAESVRIFKEGCRESRTAK